MMKGDFEEPIARLVEPEAERPAGELVTGAEKVLEVEVLGVESLCNEDRRTIESVAASQVSAFAERLSAGIAPRDAARDVGLTLGNLTADPATKALVQQLIAAFRLPAAVRRELVRAKLNEVLLTASKTGDVIAAARAIGADPEVGLEGKGGNVSVNMSFDGPTQVALDVAAETTIPGLED